MRLVLLSFVIIGFLAGCDDPIPVNTDDGRDYYPMYVGRVLEYRSDSIIFDDITGGNVQDTFTSLIREEVIDVFETMTGDSSYVVERSFRRSEVDPWKVTDLFTESMRGEFATRQEGNLSFQKLRFPLSSTTRWDPVALFDPTLEIQVGTETIEAYTNWGGEVISIGTPQSIADFDFEEVLNVRQADSDNEIERRYSVETYAEGVGLVMRVDTILDSRCKRLGDFLPCLEPDGSGALVPQPWAVKGEKGYILFQLVTNIE